MELIERKKRILLNEPHPEIVSGLVANFETDMVSVMEIEPLSLQDQTDYIYSTGSNMFDDTKRYSTGTGLYIGATGMGYEIFLKSGYYTISIDIKNNEFHDLYVRSSTASGASLIWSKSSESTSKTFQLSSTGFFRFNFYDSAGINAANIGNCWLNYGRTAASYEPYIGVKSQSLKRKTYPGINNVWAQNGQVTVKYWKH